jgi:hypothetical protein
LTGSDQILAELFEAGDYSLRCINSSVLFGIRKYFLISGRSLLLYQFTRRPMKLNVIIIMRYHCYQLHTTFFFNILLSRISPVGTSHSVARAGDIYTLHPAAWLSVHPHKHYPTSAHNCSSANWFALLLAAMVYKCGPPTR